MTSMQAAIGIEQLKKLNYILKKKKQIKSIYKNNLSQKNFAIFPLNENKNSVEWL